MTGLKNIDHVLISIPPGNKQGAVHFYAKVLELPQIPGDHPRGALWFTMGGIELHVREEEGHNPTSDRHIAFTVENLAEVATFLEIRHIAVINGSGIGGRSRIFFRDPWGNRFELIEYNRPA